MAASKERIVSSGRSVRRLVGLDRSGSTVDVKLASVEPAPQQPYRTDGLALVVEELSVSK